MTKHEWRMRKECQSTNARRSTISAIPHLIIRHSFELRNSDFVIVFVFTSFLRPEPQPLY
jgi:hypothetical protein